MIDIIECELQNESWAEDNEPASFLIKGTIDNEEFECVVSIDPSSDDLNEDLEYEYVTGVDFENDRDLLEELLGEIIETEVYQDMGV